MIRVYVAGRYSADNIMECLGNIRRGIEISRDLLLKGYAPFCPWLDCMYVLTASCHDFINMNKQMFQDCSMAWVEASDCLLVTSMSNGVQREIDRAKELGIPVFETVTALDEWMRAA